MSSRIEDYGLIGNTLCAPRFDSDALLAALVGYDEHGCWAIRPATGVLILETDFS